MCLTENVYISLLFTCFSFISSGLRLCSTYIPVGWSPSLMVDCRFLAHRLEGFGGVESGPSFTQGGRNVSLLAPFSVPLPLPVGIVCDFISTRLQYIFSSARFLVCDKIPVQNRVTYDTIANELK